MEIKRLHKCQSTPMFELLATMLIIAWEVLSPEAARWFAEQYIQPDLHWHIGASDTPGDAPLSQSIESLFRVLKRFGSRKPYGQFCLESIPQVICLLF